MLTLTVPLQRFAALRGRSAHTSRPVRRERLPPSVSRRTRSDVLHMLVGADSGRSPYVPRRRPTR